MKTRGKKIKNSSGAWSQKNMENMAI